MNNQLISKLVQKRLILPAVIGSKGNSKVLARQLDVSLMENGFKLSGDLLAHIGGLHFDVAIKQANLLLDAVKSLVGAHVKHNTYFIDFPKNVPDTLEFWARLLAKHYEEGGSFTNNLLDFASYGSYQHTYEEMLERHDTFKSKGTKLKVVNLGNAGAIELLNLYGDLAGSKVPLNEDDRKLIADLYRANYSDATKILVRENKAIINALHLEAQSAIDVDTPVDILRLACYLSGGDVTLLENTKLKSMKRGVRRQLLGALDALLTANHDKIEDINRFKERFKRLAKMLHPREFEKQFPEAVKAFDFACGGLVIKTWGNKVHASIQGGRIGPALKLLAEKPGYFVRSLDKLTRDSSDAQFAAVLKTLKEVISDVSGRVLLSVAEHLDNRSTKPLSRIFVNRAGKGWAMPNQLETLSTKRIKSLSIVIWKELERRIPSKKAICINDDLTSVAVPLSDKTKSEGFRVLPRGSVLDLDKTKNVLRFFVYWHQTAERTDYDLSCALYDKDFNFINQLSWTQLDGVGGCHSGDITSAPNGASEFIDLDLKKLDKNVAYILPSINCFTGEPFSQCKDAFMGYMSRDSVSKGAPFEAKTVQTKLALRGDKNGVGIPMVFMRGQDGWSAKWLDLYSRGQPWGNRVEASKFSTALLARAIIDRKYLTMGKLADLYRAKAKKVYKLGAKLPKFTTYIGLDRPENLSVDEVYTLDNIKSLIPA